MQYVAVRDSIKSSEAMLNSFENTIGMKSMVEKVEKALEFIEQEENIQNKKDELIKILK